MGLLAQTPKPSASSGGLLSRTQNLAPNLTQSISPFNNATMQGSTAQSVPSQPNAVVENLKNIVGGPAERAQAIFQSVKQRSFEPLKQSFKKQADEDARKIDLVTGQEKNMSYANKVRENLYMTQGLTNLVAGFTGHGGSAELPSLLAKETNAARVAARLKKTYPTLDDEVIATFSPKIAATKNVTEVEKLLAEVTTTKPAVRPIETAPTPEPVRTPEINTATDQTQIPSQPIERTPTPLPEASSYKSDITKLANSELNVERLDISPEARNIVSKTVEEVKPLIEQTIGRVLTNAEAVRLAESSSALLTKAVGRDQTLAFEAALLKSRQALSAAAESGTVDQAFIDNLLAIKSQGTDIARRLQSLSIKAEGIEPTAMQAIVEAVLKVNQNTEDVLRAANGVNFKDLTQATNFYRQFVKPKLGEWLDLVRYNSMLSSPKTHIINTFSNLVNTTVMAPLEKALTGGLDFLGSKITGNARTAYAGESGAFLKGYFANVREATFRFADVLRGTRSYTNLDTKNIPIAAKGFKGGVVKSLSFPMRLLEASDQFFTALAEGGATRSLEYRNTKMGGGFKEGAPTSLGELEPLAAEARKYGSVEEFVQAIKATPEKIPSSPEYRKFLSENDAYIKREKEIYAELKAMRDKFAGKTIKDVPPKDIAKYDSLQKELNETLSKKTLAKSPEGIIKTHIGEKGLASQLTDFYNEVKAVAPQRSFVSKVGNIESKAQAEAAYRLFRQKPLAENEGHLLNAIDQFTVKVQSLRNSPNPIVSTVSKFTVPFLQTPMNILKQGIEYSPVGLGTLPGAANKTEQLSKAIIGSAMFTGAAMLLTSNRLTWGEPIDPTLKAAFRAGGMQAYSVKIGNTWYSYQKLPPGVAFPLAMVAMISDTKKNAQVDDNTVELILGGVAKYGQFLADQSYAKSIGDLLAAAKGGESGIERVVSNYAQQLVPYRALGGWMARIVDPTQRKVDNQAGFIDQQVQLLMMNFPGLSQKVPARVDAQGNPIPQPNRFLNAVSPIMTSQENAQGPEYNALTDIQRLNKLTTAGNQQQKSAAEQAVQAINALGTPDEKKAYLQQLAQENPDLVKTVIQKLKDANNNIGTADQRLLNSSNETRARYIVEQLNKLGTPEEKKALLKDYATKKIITQATLLEVAKLLKK